MLIVSDFGFANKTLTPTFAAFKRLDVTFSAVTPLPEIRAVTGTGLYVFEFAPEPDVEYVFVMDGGASLDSAVRYVAGTVSGATSVADAGKIVNVVVKAGGGGVYSM